ncbi:gallidermin/nisin family lantibiotic [Aceticella autotrophica]|uniref:Gallidermin/nisin family lantibiotic n=2 Tax=Aceticella autotrophica TaxID=2755338 RepID=A0A975GBF6_9THEO|nr:gallidermin/nisin family lantibiotic [Aceticella autotrophica]
MKDFNDFDLDVQIKKNNQKIEPDITSKSLCTPGCITGILMCFTQGCFSNHSCIACRD